MFFKSPKLYIYVRITLWLLLIVILIPAINFIFLNHIIIIEWTIIRLINTPIILTLILDPIGLAFSITVILISANVLSFSSIYIDEDKFINRFTIIVLLFIISINLLIYIPHIIALLLGWDGLGLVSFILVIYYQNHKSLAAGLITAISNRVGDAILLIAIALTLDQGHWFIINITITPALIYQVILIIVAAITKSAQIPFSSWLPAAIAAPTPVSALVHSSTLVTAGVFLLIRFYPFLHSFSSFNTILLLIATCTIFIAGLRALTECDIKKIIALSTLRQLGIIITSLALNLPILTFFHIVTHALFKALLFIGAGAFINYHIHSQDLRWIGNLNSQIPVASSCITIANLALCGFPFIAGFYSKDLIMEIASMHPINIIIFSLIMLRIGLTRFYSIRFSIATILSPSNSSSWILIKEQSNINTPIIILSFIAIISGALLIWIDPIRNSTVIIPQLIKLLPSLFILIGLIIGYYISTSNSLIFSQTNNISHYALCIIWFLVPLSTQFIIKFPFWIAHLNLKSIDQGWIEFPQFLHYSLNINNSAIISFHPQQAAQLIIISSLSILLFATSIYSSNLLKIFHWSWKKGSPLNNQLYVV